jgi:hypothetical protein
MMGFEVAQAGKARETVIAGKVSDSLHLKTLPIGLLAGFSMSLHAVIDQAWLMARAVLAFRDAIFHFGQGLQELVERRKVGQAGPGPDVLKAFFRLTQAFFGPLGTAFVSFRLLHEIGQLIQEVSDLPSEGQDFRFLFVAGVLGCNSVSAAFHGRKAGRAPVRFDADMDVGLESGLSGRTGRLSGR